MGTQPVAGLAASSASTPTFNWNTTTAVALGGHTLVATLTLSDANAANNQGSTTITVNAPTTDVAVTSVTAPPALPTGNTPSISVTVHTMARPPATSTVNEP